jgi:hypothetical protein
MGRVDNPSAFPINKQIMIKVRNMKQKVKIELCPSSMIEMANCNCHRVTNDDNNIIEYIKVLTSVITPLATLGFGLWAFKKKEDYKEEKGKSFYHYKCEMDIKKAQMIHDIRTQVNDAATQNSTQEEEAPKWEDFNDAVYGHTNEKHLWLVGNVINMGGTHLLFGPKGSCKTMFVTTLADAISKGTEYRLFVSDNANPCNQPPQQVFLYDLEMQYSDLNRRNGKHGYSFSNISRCDHSSFTVDSWLRNVKKVIDGLTCNATIFLDNITRLVSDISQPTICKKLFDGIKSLKDEAKMKGVIVTFILIAHTTNNRKDKDPITLKDAAFADTLTTGMDSISIIGTIKDTNKIFLKAYNLRHAPAPSEVTILELRDKPFMRFEIVGTDIEDNILPIKKTSAKNSHSHKSEDKPSEPEVRKGWSLSKAEEIEKAYNDIKRSCRKGGLRIVGKRYGVTGATVRNIITDLNKYRAEHSVAV